MKFFSKKSAKIGAMGLLVVGLILGLAVPSLAAKPSATPDKPNAPKLWTGKVSAIAADNTSFDVKNGDKPAVNVKVDANTKYWLVTLPAGGLGSSEKDDKPQLRPQAGVGKNDKGQGLQRQAIEKAKQVIEDRLQALRKFAKPGTFADLAVGAQVVVPVVPSGSPAKDVLIIKTNKLPLARVHGIITAVTANSISIKKADNTVVTLNWDAKSRFVLQGLISVQAGQTASAVYNTETMHARVVHVKPTPSPTPTP